MATISTNSTSNSRTTTGGTYVYHNPIDAENVAQMIESVRESHLRIIKDQEERIVALEEHVTKLRDTLDEYKDLLAAGIARQHEEQQRNAENKRQRDIELEAANHVKPMLNPDQLQRMRMIEQRLKEDEMRRDFQKEYDKAKIGYFDAFDVQMPKGPRNGRPKPAKYSI